MGAVLESITFDHALFEAELTKLGNLLASKTDLSERDDIQPLFKASRHLSAFLGTFAPDIGPATELVYEFPFFGDYRADLLVGSKSAAHFCVVEFEDGGPDSIFKKQPNRPNPEWNARFEHGFSQLTDWFFNLDDYKKSHGFTKTFGYGHVSFTGLLVVGRSASLDDMKRTRLRWRSNKVLIDSNAVICVTFDDVYEIHRKRYAQYKAAASLEK
ncbi:Shedu anti-phage system protein SduA domain-containing protein [Singulisphaera sp. Ch08]|uniref:Shedu anti-phage system protein SduA domain-containing protein n=1 Tax=Singulisphaera sp. Ch08 TaxID=3120278 RepID=A0AAU7CKR9_9BACT